MLPKMVCQYQVADFFSLYTSGLADPGPIASIFWMDDDLGSDIYLDGIVTLVDAKYISQVRTLLRRICRLIGCT